MASRRAVLTALGGVALAGGGYTQGAYHGALTQVGMRLHGQSAVIDMRVGALEYAVAGSGPPLMMIHGTGGGFDQRLLFASRLRDLGFQIVAPSRFGHLCSAFPDDPSPARQADVLVELLDHLGIDRIPVAGRSACAFTAAEFAVRHPDRCSHLVLLLPCAQNEPVAAAARQPAAEPSICELSVPSIEDDA
jgi:2-hydroxy-6-oxonona-2,4-dienedioate hydrolase